MEWISFDSSTLAERWAEETGEPLNRGIGHGYAPMQVLFDAVERAGTLDKVAINEAMAETNLETLNYLTKFDPETHLKWSSPGQRMLNREPTYMVRLN